MNINLQRDKSILFLIVKFNPFIKSKREKNRIESVLVNLYRRTISEFTQIFNFKMKKNENQNI
jgi:hypothetical protein